MNIVIKISCVIGFLTTLVSCSTSNSVVSNRWIQKRKYTKGWFVKNKGERRVNESKREDVRIPEQDEFALKKRLIRSSEKEVKPLISVQELISSHDREPQNNLAALERSKEINISDLFAHEKEEVVQKPQRIMEERTVSNLLPETKSYGYSNDTASSLIVVFLVLLGVAAVLSLFLEAEVLLLLLGIVVVGLGLFLLIYLLSGLVNFMLGI